MAKHGQNPKENSGGDTFGDMIAGSGAAGSIPCRRLTEDPGVTVCVLECGPPGQHIMPNMPSANSYSSTTMIAEKASDMIQGRPPLATVEGIAA